MKRKRTVWKTEVENSIQEDVSISGREVSLENKKREIKVKKEITPARGN